MNKESKYGQHRGYFWQAGHQYVMRLSSPWPLDLTLPRQRGQGLPAIL